MIVGVVLHLLGKFLAYNCIACGPTQRILLPRLTHALSAPVATPIPSYDVLVLRESLGRLFRFLRFGADWTGWGRVPAFCCPPFSR